MSRLIFTVYDEVLDPDVTDFKKKQLKDYKDILTTKQSEYASKCNAEYKVVNSKKDKYDNIQFSKIKLLRQFTESYKEVLYLDLDVVPSKSCSNIFEQYNFDKLVCFYEDCDKRLFDLFPKPKAKFKYISTLDHMSWWIKMAAKNSMLMLDDYSTSNYIINTGVLGGSYDVIKNLEFEENFNDMINLLEESKDDNLYPQETAQHFRPNNEIFLTYLVEKNKTPSEKIDESWNYILDDMRSNWPDNVNLFHVISKEFSLLEKFL
tara:strand:+ start:1218 stop:2006 length:789 start_codon:yes stop_codon:yes gene_type:complete